MRAAAWRGLVALAAAGLLSGCGIAGESNPRLLDPDAAPYRAVGEAPQPAPTGSARVRIYLVRDGSLVAVVRQVPSKSDLADVVQALLAGPTKPESDSGLTTATPREVEGVSLSLTKVATVDLPAPAADTTRSDETLGYAQLVLTLDDLAAVDAVQFTRQGSPLAVPRGDGSVTEAPLTRRDFLDLL